MTFRQFAFKNVGRSKRVYIGHFLSSTFAVIIFFTFGLIAFHPALEGDITKISSKMNSLGKGAFEVSQYIIYLFSIFFILYSVSSFLKKRKKEFGILMVLGLSPRQFTKLVFYENIIIGYTATVVGIVIGLVFSKLILLISASVLTLEKGLPFYFPSRAIANTGIGFMLMFVFISLFTSKTIKVTKLVDLIKSEEKPKPAPHASVWLSLLAVLLICLGYGVVFYFAMYLNEMTTKEMLGYMAIVVVLVVLGTYFLFTQLSVYMLKAIKQKDRIFLKKTNILIVSDLVYRIKDNAVTFFLASVLSTVAFTAIGTTAAVGDVLLNQLDQTFAIKYDSSNKNDEEQKHVTMINRELDNANIPFTMISTSYLMHKNEYSIMKLSDFNQYARKLGYSSFINENDYSAFVIEGFTPNQGPEKGDDINLYEGQLTVHIQKIVASQYFASNFPQILVSDSVYSKLVNHYEENGKLPEHHRYGYIIKEWKNTHELAEKLGTELKYQSVSQDYNVTLLSLDWQFMKQLNGIFSILTVLVGIVFFVFASSFLYFRLFTDLERDQEKYRMLSKIGLSKREINRIVTSEMSVLFFLPFIAAVIHSCIAFIALQKIVDRAVGHVPLTENMVFVLVSFLSFHLLYFFIMRRSYLSQI